MGSQQTWGPNGWETTKSEDVKASAAAKAKADELDVDLAGIVGSGSGGAITVADVEEAADE
jgi:pyruvate/2-oxoglutarate dehydrogenase complex dihydrolipoamide acyltransferase (E2) component